MSVSAQYLARADLRLGSIAARHHPVLHARLADTARTLGSDEVWVRDQWSALAQLAALHGVLPGQVSSEQLDSGGDALLAAFARPGHPKAGHKLRSALVRLRATLFHAGMTDTPPRLHRPNRGVVASAQWAAVAPGLTETAQRYLAQIELSLRPSTVRIAEQVLREFTAFLAREAPGVSCVGDIGRHHIEAYKSWLAHRPRAGGGTLHRHTIRGHLTTLRCFFDRITEWDYPDAPTRPLIFAGDLPIPDQPLPRFLDDAASAKLLRAAREALGAVPFVATYDFHTIMSYGEDTILDKHYVPRRSHRTSKLPDQSCCGSMVRHRATTRISSSSFPSRCRNQQRIAPRGTTPLITGLPRAGCVHPTVPLIRRRASRWSPIIRTSIRRLSKGEKCIASTSALRCSSILAPRSLSSAYSSSICFT
jgi:hypothetical protein